MNIVTHGPYVVGRDLTMYQSFCLAQRLWDVFSDGDGIYFSIDSERGFLVTRNFDTPFVCFEIDNDGDVKSLYKLGMYKSLRGAIRSFSRRAKEFRSCKQRLDLCRRYADCEYIVWDAYNGLVYYYRHYYGHNTRLDVFNLGGLYERKTGH